MDWRQEGWTAKRLGWKPEAEDLVWVIHNGVARKGMVRARAGPLIYDVQLEDLDLQATPFFRLRNIYPRFEDG